MVLGFGDYLDVVREVEYCRCPHCGGWEMAVCSLPLYVVGSKDGRVRLNTHCTPPAVLRVF
jgi:hypothetical protein